MRGSTYPRFFDFVRDLDKKLFIFLCILASDEDLDRETTALDLVEMFRCTMIRVEVIDFALVIAPFFAVVRIYKVSVVNSMSVVGNS